MSLQELQHPQWSDPQAGSQVGSDEESLDVDWRETAKAARAPCDEVGKAAMTGAMIAAQAAHRAALKRILAVETNVTAASRGGLGSLTLLPRRQARMP